jgi:hypothetical protein
VLSSATRHGLFATSRSIVVGVDVVHTGNVTTAPSLLGRFAALTFPR